MLKRLWQWLRRFIQRLFRSKQTVSPQLREQQTVEITQQLTDTEYESLFLQLLAEVNDGLGRGGVKGFLAAKHINEANLVEWLRGFGERLLASTAANDELAARLVRFGELGVGELGDVARDIGKRLTNRRGAEDAEEGEGKSWFKQGYEQLMAGDFTGAIASYDKAISIKPDDHLAWYGRGIALGNLGRNEEAIASYDKAISIRPDDHLAWYGRGIALGNLGRNEEAIASYEKALEIQPDYHEVWYNRGVVLGNLGRNEEAIASYEKALEFKPDFHETWHNRGVALTILEHYEEAITSFDNALKFKPDFHETWHNRGVVLGNLRRNEEAIASYDNALKFQPELHIAWNNRGVALLNLGRNKEAIASCDNALKFKPDDHRAWNNRGLSLANLGCNEEAIASCDNALKSKPDYHEAWNNRGLSLANLGRYEEAIASYENALKFKPDFHIAWNNRGAALNNLGRYEEAIASYENALKFKPNFHEVWNNRGAALNNLGLYEEAIASYENALKFQPDLHVAWYKKGDVLRNVGRYEEAIASYDNALKFQPELHIAWNNRGVALNELGRYEEAIASYDNALKFQPELHIAWNNRGASLNELGRYEEAIASYDNALKFQPDFHEVWRNRGLAAGNSVSFNQLLAFSSSIATQNPQLNQRGYEGQLTTYEQGLKYYHQDTHPEDWGKLHQAIGKAHYFRGRRDSYPRSYWHKAINSYNEALKSLTEADFPELHLEVLQDLIRVQSDLGETAKAEELQRRGTDLLRRLLNGPNCTDQSKKQLALKFAWLQQLTVDLAVQSGHLLQAVELAEQGKNACLSWLLDGWSDEISSPSYSGMQQLLNSTTAVVYWHLSSYALHTFILKHNNTEPIVLGETGVLNQPQRLRDFEDWLKKWNEKYADYRQVKKGEIAGTWRDNLPEMLQSLGDILDINAIVSHIPDITQLILIPHRDLHRLPLHALFPDELIITYLPSAQIGINLKKIQQTNVTSIYELPLLSVEHPNSENFQLLPHAEIESAIITQLFNNPPPQRLAGEVATNAAVKAALKGNHGIFHFTGHGTYNFHHPKQSFLALSKRDRLTLEEICYIENFNRYQLVSLAACETAITSNQTITSEYMGLVSAFVFQGVANVVSTLWTVTDEASSFLMIYFYRQIQQGKSPDIALKQAQKWLRNLTFRKLARIYRVIFDKLPADETLIRPFIRDNLYLISEMSLAEKHQKRFQSPYYWAGFIITGVHN